MRPGVIAAIHEHMKKNESSYFLTGDLGYSVLETLEKDFPSRVINMGVAEQNMIGVASGLALQGNKVFVYSIIPFITMRCYEQIRDDICYHNLDVMIIGIGAGLSYGVLSATHFALEDVGIMRPLANMSIFSPSDEYEAIAGVKALLKQHHPVYVRIGKKVEPTIFDQPYNFVFGKGHQIIHGDDIVIFATGPILSQVVSAAELLKTKGISASIVDIHTIKPLDNKIILQQARGKKLAISVEEHNMIGGFGSAIAEVLAQSKDTPPLHIIGTQDRFIKEIGTHDYLREIFNLSAEGLTSRIIQVYRKV